MKSKLLAFVMLLSLAGYGQNTLKGRVTDENDQGLPGVNVLIKGTTQGSVTDANGEYRLDQVSPDGVIVFSFIGYISQEVAVSARTTVDIKMQPDIQSLQEVVVVGYGTSTVKELTGSVSVVNGSDLTKLNPVRMDQALQGQAAGVQISAASGSPGGALNIRIRGLSTNLDNNPLVLVDGVIYSTEGLNALNPSDIESINVLKDATAAIYGVQAANGVIIITTKQGKKGAKPSLEFSGYYGMQQTAKKLNLLNATEFAVLKNEMYAAGNQTAPYNNVNLGTGTNWQNEVFENAPIQNYNLNLNGGSDKSTYSIGGSFLDQEGIVGRDKASYRRYNARLNFVTDITPKLSLQNVLLYTNEKRKTLYENGISSVLFNTINANPISSPFNSDGSFSYLTDVSEVINPLAQMANTYNETNVNKVTGKQELTYKVNSAIQISGRAGYNYAIVDDKSFSPLVYYGNGKAQNTAADSELNPKQVEILPDIFIPVPSNVTETRSTYFNYSFEGFINFSKTFRDVHKVKGMLGTSLYGDVNSSNSGTGYNVPYNSWEFADISATDDKNLLNNTSSWQNKKRVLSYYGRAEYNFKDKYLFSAILRRDASSNFGKNNRFGYFPAFSAAWVLSEEEFFQSSLLQFVKIRGSYGVSGNDKIPLFRYRALLGGEAVYPFNDQLTNGSAIGILGNQDLKWETTHQTNFGADINLIQGKLEVGLDYYVKKTNDLLFQPDISAIGGAYGAGGSPPFVNAGDIKNTGLELLISYKTNIGEDLQLNIGYNLTTIKNEVTALPKGVDFYEYGAFSVGGGYATRMEVGKPIGYFFGYKTDGVYQTTSEITERGVTQQGAAPGDLRYKDLDNSGTISFGDNKDKTMIGSPIPEFTMGLNLGVNYKGFDFSTTLYASIGNEILRNYERQLPLSNMLDYKINRWTGEGSTNEHPRLTTAPNKNGELSDYFIEDGSFLRIKNIQVGYSLPKSIGTKIGARNIRVYVAANNLVTFTKYMGFDPDFSTNSPLASGIDYGFYPQARTIMAGLNLNF